MMSDALKLESSASPSMWLISSPPIAGVGRRTVENDLQHQAARLQKCLLRPRLPNLTHSILDPPDHLRLDADAGLLRPRPPHHSQRE